MIWLHAHRLLPLRPIGKLVQRHTARLRKSDNLLVEGGGRGAESYDRKKALSSTNHSILSALLFYSVYVLAGYNVLATPLLMSPILYF